MLRVTAKVVRKTHRRIVVPASDRLKVKVGFIGGAQVDKALWQEFGTAGGASGGGWGGPIPERPFMRNTMRENRDAYMRRLLSSARAILNNEVEFETVLARLGAQVQGDIQATITAGVPPPLSPVTIERKGSLKPLIDTGAMRQGVSWELV